MRIGSLFAGIGGLELGLEWAGVGHTVWQVDREPFCQRVLAKHWPDAQRFDDVRAVGAHNLAPVEVICGGFPCQDLSYAGKRAGITGERSGLWFEFARIVRELEPRFVVVENVAALLDSGLGVVLGTLADLGFDAEWSNVSACSVGAPHMRQRVFIVAHANGIHGRARVRDSAARKHGTIPARDRAPSSRASWGTRMENPSELYGGANGLPNGMDRNHAIGNAVVPQVAELVGRRLMEIAGGR